MAKIDLTNGDALKQLDELIKKIQQLTEFIDNLSTKNITLSIDESMLEKVVAELSTSKEVSLEVDENKLKDVRKKLEDSLSNVFVDIDSKKNGTLSTATKETLKKNYSTYIDHTRKEFSEITKKILDSKNLEPKIPPFKNPTRASFVGENLPRNNPKLNATEYLLIYGDMESEDAAMYRSLRRKEEKLKKEQLYAERRLEKEKVIEKVEKEWGYSPALYKKGIGGSPKDLRNGNIISEREYNLYTMLTANQPKKNYKKVVVGRNEERNRLFEEFLQDKYRSKSIDNFEDERLSTNYSDYYLQLQRATMQRQMKQQIEQLNKPMLLLEYKPDTQNIQKLNTTDLITYSKSSKKTNPIFAKTVQKEIEKLKEQQQKQEEQIATKIESKDKTEKSKKAPEERDKYSGKYDYYRPLENDDAQAFYKAFRENDTDTLGKMSTLVENKYGRSALKDLTSIARGMAYNDATYGKEARELKNLISAETQMRGFGKSQGNFFDILQNLRSPAALVKFGTNYFQDLFTKQEEEYHVKNTQTYKKWIKERNLNPKDKDTYKKFTKDKSSYANALKDVLGNKSAMNSISDAKNLGSIIGIAILGLTKLAKAASDFGKAAIASYENIQSLQTRMAVIYGSQSEANASFNEIEEYAKKSPFGIETMTQQAILLKQSGVAGKDLMNTMQRIGDVASGNAEKMRSVSETYARIMSSTTVTARDMRQLANAGVPAYSALAESLRKNGASIYNYDLNRSANISNASIRSMLQTGKITSEDFANMIKELTNKGGTFYGATERGAKTILARKQNLADMKQMALAAVGENLVNMGGAIGVDSWYNTLLDIKEGVWETVENTAKKKDDKRNERTVEEATRLAEVYKNEAEANRRKGLVASVDYEIHSNSDKRLYYKELAEDYQRYENYYAKESKKYSEIAAEAYVSRVSYAAQQYDEALERLQSAPKRGPREIASIADGTTAQSIQADIIASLLSYQRRRGKKATATRSEYEELKEKVLKLLPQAALVSFEKSLSRGAESVNEFANSINGAQTRMLKAKTNYDNSSYGSYKLTLQQRAEDAQLRKRLDSYSGYFSNGKINNRAVKYNAGLQTRTNLLKDAASSAEQLPIGFTDLFELVGDNANLKINALSNWQKYSDNITTFAQNFANMSDEFKTKSGLGNSLSILLQRISESANGNLTQETYQSATVARMEFEKILTNTIARLSNKQNRTDADNTLLANLENAKIVFDAAGSDIEYDISNKNMLNKRTSPLLIQSILGNAAGVDSAIIRRLSDDNKLSNNQIFKQFVNPMMNKNAFGSLTTSLLSAGMSLKQISQNLKIDADATSKIKKDIDNRLIDDNKLTAYDWTRSLTNLEKLAVQGTLEQRQAVVSNYENQLNQLTDIVTKGITTTEALEDIVDPASELGSALSFATQNVKSGSIEFKDTLLKTIDDMSNELRQKITNLKLDNIIKSSIEKTNLSSLSNVTKTSLLTSGSSYFNSRQQSFIKNSDVLTTLTSDLLEEARKNSFNGVATRGLNLGNRDKILNSISLLSGIEKYNFESIIGKNDVLDIDYGRVEEALKQIDEEQKNGELSPKQEKIWNETLSFLLISNDTMSNYIDSLQALDESTKKLEKTQESINNQSKLNDIMQNSLGFRNYGQQETNGSVSSLSGRKNRTPFNSKAEKTYLSALGFAEDTKLEDVYKSLSENYSNFLNNKYIQSTRNNTGKRNDEIVDRFTKGRNQYISSSDAQKLAGMYNEFSSLDNLKSQVLDNLTWKTTDIITNTELQNYIKNNGDLLGNVGQYLVNGGGDYLLKAATKETNKGSIEYTALESGLGAITSNGEFNGDLMGVANILSQLDDLSLTDKLSEGLSKVVIMTDEITKSWENLGISIRDAFDTALLNDYLSGMKNLGTLQYKVANGAMTQEEATKEINKNLASQASALLEQVSTNMANAGLQIAGASALSQNWGGVAGGLLLAAAGGIGNFASGILSGYSSDNNKDDDKLERIEALKNNLADLIEQARNDAIYYETSLRNKSALSFNEAVSATKVNDMILTPQGNFSTSPQDYLIATKNPQSLVSNSPNISFNIVNNGEPVRIESTQQSNTSNGIDLQVVINSMVKKSINDGDYDDTFKSVYLRQQGNIVSA